MAGNARVFAYPFSDIYKLYVQKVERKDRAVEELDEVLTWLTGYDVETLHTFDGDLADFFESAPSINPGTAQITGIVCGVRVEDIEDPLIQKIRWMDKVVDELAKGKKLEKILRS